MATAAVAPRSGSDLSFRGSWPLVLGFSALALPTLLALANQSWSREAGAHGPIILATGGWLLWRQMPVLKREGAPGSVWITVAILLVSLPIYILGSVLDYITLQAAGVYGAGLAVLHGRFGVRALARIWFPLFYLAFAVPPPTALIDHLTQPLKHFASFVSTATLSAFGLPVARQGVTIFIGQYQLLVEDACSGMNSIVGLTAISLLYIYLTRGSRLVYSIFLTCFVIPIAIISNIIRIMFLILLTYTFGDEVGQSFIHYAAGFFLFGTSLLMVFTLDRGAFLVYDKLKSRS